MGGLVGSEVGVSDDESIRDNQFERAQQKAAQRGFGPAPGVGRAVQQRLAGAVPTCAAPGCTSPGGAFTTERGGLIYEFCSESCRTKFESQPA
jgi:hypothetical protein